jgi:hypothetical protein
VSKVTSAIENGDKDKLVNLGFDEDGWLSLKIEIDGLYAHYEEFIDTNKGLLDFLEILGEKYTLE